MGDAGGTVCAGIQMQKTIMLIEVMIKAVAHLTLTTCFLLSATTWIRLMMICISNWISKTQKNSNPNNTGTLVGHVG